MRKTKYHQIALERLAEALGIDIVDAPESGRGHVTLDLRPRVPEKYHDDEWLMKGFVHTGSKNFVLARLVIAALEPPSVGWDLTVKQVKDIMLLTDCTDRGLAGHEYQTLRSCTLAWDVPPRNEPKKGQHR